MIDCRHPDAHSHADMSAEDVALLHLLEALKLANYRFVCPTPASHARVLARDPDRMARNLRDVFGWSRAFAPELLDDRLLHPLQASGMIEPQGKLLKSRIRVSSLGSDLFLHSAYPTEDKDAVFFGPDSYRFARLIIEDLARCPPLPGTRLVDMGAGTGVGAIVASRCCPDADIVMTDINPLALRFARINAVAAGARSGFHLSDGLSSLTGKFDIILANPPYIIDDHGRDYRDGGGLHGAEVALDMAREAVARLAVGGRFILYTGSAITADGADSLAEYLNCVAASQGCAISYEELDPDVFGEELETPAYRDVERIALARAVIFRPDAGV